MSKELDIDQNLKLWVPAFSDFIEHKSVSCPRCGSNQLSIVSKVYSDHYGYLLMTCRNCNKSGYFSRVRFPEDFQLDQQ